MSHLRLLLCRVEDEQHPEQMTQIAAVDLPETQLSDLTQQTCLDTLEERTLQAGHALMGPLFEAQWNEVDTLLTQQKCQGFSPSPSQKGRTGPSEGGEPLGHADAQAPSALRVRGRRAFSPR
jgi:hypothetical protein